MALTLSLAAVSGRDLGEGASSISALWMRGNKGGKTRERNENSRGKTRAVRSTTLEENRDRSGQECTGVDDHRTSSLEKRRE